MTRHPYGHDELDRVDPELDAVAQEIERSLEGDVADAPAGLRARVHAAIDAEPDPAIGWWRRLTGGAGSAGGRRPVGAFAGAALAVLVLVAAVAVGQFIRDARENVGASPSPSAPASPTTPSATPSPSPTLSPSPSPSPSPTVRPTPTPTVVPTSVPTVTPTASGDDDDDDDETPEPSETDNSGPGGGGGDDDD